VICDEIKKRHGIFVMDQGISCSVSLNIEYGNTYFTLIEEQAFVEIQLSLSHTLLLSNLPRGLSFEGKHSSLGEVV
jgi:hypothetical protein